MASAVNVDVVLVIDTSISMKPCIDQVRSHLRDLIKPLQGHSTRVRFGLLAMAAANIAAEGIVYRIATIAGGVETIPPLYHGGSEQIEYFTTDPDKIITALDGLQVSGDEDNLMALDIALDFPFGPTSNTKRVIAMFSDEKLENGVQRSEVKKYIPQLVEKLHARRVKLFCAVPYSPAAQQLSEANGSEIEDVGDGDGLGSVDFKALLTQMGKSISVSSLQGALDEKYQHALFGQDKWEVGDFSWNEDDN